MVRHGLAGVVVVVRRMCPLGTGWFRIPHLLATPPQKRKVCQLITQILEAIFIGLSCYLENMEMLLEKQLQAALSERKAVMGEFLRLKAELARTQQRNDDLRSENKALREALHAAEHEVSNLFAYASELGEEASS